MINIPKMKLPKRYTEIIRKHKNSTPEEKLKLKMTLLKLSMIKIVNFITP